MFDADGKELRDLPFEVRDSYCPGCAVLEEHLHDAPKGDERRRGVTPYLAPFEDDDAPLHPEDPADSG